MKIRYLLFTLMLSFVLIGCSKMEDTEEIESIVEEPIISVEEFLCNAEDAYKDIIGHTEVGIKIVERWCYEDSIEYTVHTFDNMGFVISHYYFTADESKHINNYTARLTDVDYNEDSLKVDNALQVVSFDLNYVDMQENAYNYFRDVILYKFKEEAYRLQLSEGELPDTVKEDEGTYSVIGDLAEYIVELPELEVDENGYTLCSNNDECWDYLVSASGLIITGYKSDCVGDKLVIPSVINNKLVYAVRNLSPLNEVKIVEVEEGIAELQGTFTNWENLSQLILHDGVLSLSQDCIKGTAIKEIALPTTIVHLEDKFFEDFTVGNVGDFKFGLSELNGIYQNSDIVSIIIPSTIKKVKSFAFDGCDNLTTVFVEEGCVEIESKAFTGAVNLQAVALPESINYIQPDSFNSDVLLLVVADSYAERFAKANGFQYGLK